MQPRDCGGSLTTFPTDRGFIEHELLNLLPFTTYTFSVQDGERRREGEKEGDWPKGAVRLSAKGPVSEGGHASMVPVRAKSEDDR